MNVNGQVAVVSGAGKGIGMGCALALAEARSEVMAMTRTEHHLDDLVKTIGGRNEANTVAVQAAMDGGGSEPCSGSGARAP